MEMILLCLINIMHNKRVGVNISKILSGEFSARQAQREVVKSGVEFCILKFY